MGPAGRTTQSALIFPRTSSSSGMNEEQKSSSRLNSAGVLVRHDREHSVARGGGELLDVGGVRRQRVGARLWRRDVCGAGTSP